MVVGDETLNEWQQKDQNIQQVINDMYNNGILNHCDSNCKLDGTTDCTETVDLGSNPAMYVLCTNANEGLYMYQYPEPSQKSHTFLTRVSLVLL